MFAFLGNTLETITLLASQHFKRDIPSMVDLETESRDGRNLLTVRGDYLSLIELRGMTRLLTNAEIEQGARAIESNLGHFVNSRGRQFEFFFLADPARSASAIEAHIKPSRNIAKALGMDVGALMDERQALWSSAMCIERTFLTLRTNRSVLNKAVTKAEMNRAADARTSMPPATKAQKFWLDSPQLAARHEAFVTSCMNAFRNAGVQLRRLTPHDALREIRESFDPGTAGQKWRPRLLSDPAPIRRPDSDPGDDMSHFMNPPVSDQIVRWQAQHAGPSHVEMGPYRFGAVDMTIPPEMPQRFADLYLAMRKPAVPFRIRFLLDSGGGRWMGARVMWASLLAALAPVNRQIYEGLKHVAARKEKGERFVGFRCSAATWGKVGDPDTVYQRSAQLEAAIAGWGVCQTNNVAGDPLEAVMSSTVGLHGASTAPSTETPFVEALTMMPWSRTGSPWERGALLYMTAERTPYPFDPTGSKRQTVIRGYLGPQGTGKSTLTNTQNLGLILSTAALAASPPRIPLLRAVDVGTSVKGLIDLLRELLPSNLRHQIAYVRFQNRAEHFAYNIFGTQPGCRYPLAFEKELIVNVLATKFSPAGEYLFDGIPGLISAAVDQAYRMRADDHADGQPNVYEPGTNVEVDEALERHVVQLRPRATWWDVVDALYACGETRLMTMAQNYAVPLLVDLINSAHAATVADLYEHPKTDTHETMQQYFVRCVREMIKDFPILSMPTTLDLGHARVIALDMQEVCQSGGKLITAKTQIMYMVATHILARDFLLHPDHLPHMDARYTEYNRPRAQEFHRSTKLLQFDEMQKVRDCSQIMDQIETIEREGRRNAIDMALVSHGLPDFPPRIASLLSEVYILGTGYSEEAADLKERFGLNAASEDLIKTKLFGPHQLEEGGIYAAPFLALWKLEGMTGMAQQLLYNVIGPLETWALSTRPNDVELRDRLVQSLGAGEAWRRLAKVFPLGTARDEIQRRVDARSASGGDKDESAKAAVAEIAWEIENGMKIAIGLRSAAEVEEDERRSRQRREKITSWLQQPV